ncbi:MAG: hypothetical protein ACI38Q_02580 [Candidatus Bruticola sp.]
MNLSKFLLVCTLAAGMSVASFSPAKADDKLVGEALKYFNTKNYTKANTLIDQHLAKNPKDANAQYAKAMILYRMGHYIKALQRLEIVLKLAPKNHNAATAYARINQQAVYHLNQGKNDNAIALANHSVEIMPKWNIMEFRVAQAGCYFAKGTAYFERWCLSNDPEDSRIAMESWEKTRELDPTSATQQLVNGINSFISGNYALAKKYFDDGLAVRKENKYLQLWDAFANASVGEASQAMNQLTELSSLFGRNPVLHLYKGDIYKVTGDFAASRQEYMAAQDLRPSDHRITVALRLLYLCDNQVNEGLAAYNDQINQNPDDFNARYQMACLLKEAGRQAEALEAYNEIAMSPSFTPVQTASAKVCMALIHFERGEEKKATACVNPEDLQVLNSSSSPMALLYNAYADSQPAMREKACRDALLYSGPDSLFVHRSAFYALAEIEAARKQYAKSMECIFQTWRRTASVSSQCQGLSDKFDTYKNGARQQLHAEIRRLEKGKRADKEEAIQQLSSDIDTISGLELGEAGTMLFQIQGSTTESATSLVPKSITGGTATVSADLIKSSSWVNITPDWQ